MKLASLDIGLKRVGLALSLDGKIVMPQNAILRVNRKQASEDVDSFLKEWGIDTLIVGLPKGGASEEEMERRMKHFVSLLKFRGKVFYQDEYGSSYEASELMVGVTKNRGDGKLDSLAAKVILERWLEFER